MYLWENLESQKWPAGLIRSKMCDIATCNHRHSTDMYFMNTVREMA